MACEDTRYDDARQECLEIKSNRIKVGVRIRPPFQEEIQRWSRKGAGDYWDAVEDSTPNIGDSRSLQQQLGVVRCKLHDGRQIHFRFDHVFGPEIGQSQVYEVLAAPVVNSRSGAIMAYGQTGTGKSHTMGFGVSSESMSEDGIASRALRTLVNRLKAADNVGTISISMLQIYAETITDLLAPISSNIAQTSLAIKESPHEGFYVSGLRHFDVKTEEEAKHLISIGSANRAVAPTHQNVTSSRSHTILKLALNFGGGDESSILLVDLAGSERRGRSHSGVHSNTGATLKEARFINSSLSTFGNVIAALASSSTGRERRAHIPFRDCKLTRILQSALQGGPNGDGRVAIIATVGPAPQSIAASLSTLHFAQRCMRVQLHQTDRASGRNADVNLSSREMWQRELNRRSSDYESVIEGLAAELHKAREDADSLRRTLYHQNYGTVPLSHVAYNGIGKSYYGSDATNSESSTEDDGGVPFSAIDWIEKGEKGVADMNENLSRGRMGSSCYSHIDFMDGV